MLWRFGSRRDDERKASELYGRVVAQARSPVFYADCGIADTPEGRYELIVLHLVLVLERLSAGGEAGAEAQRRLAERFVTDMDDSMREMGVGDLTVPRRVKRAAAGLFERGALYRKAAESRNSAAMAAALHECLPGLRELPGAAPAMAAYVTTVRDHLAGLDLEDVVAGRVTFPPAAVSVGSSRGGPSRGEP